MTTALHLSLVKLRQVESAITGETLWGVTVAGDAQGDTATPPGEVLYDTLAAALAALPELTGVPLPEPEPDEEGQPMQAPTHHTLMRERAEPDSRDPDPQCDGTAQAVSGGFWDDVSWTVYVCQKCHTAIAAVGGGAHWWNYVISDESRARLGV